MNYATATDEVLASPMIRTFLEIAERAAEVVLEVYQGAFDVEMKGPNDPVTTADRLANQLICDALHQAYPGCPVVAEESEPDVYGDYRRAERFFFVDPVDGTREFVKRTGEFVVMLGCVEEHQAKASVIWSPTEGTRWVGLVGVGAACAKRNTEFCAISPANTSPISKGRILVSRAQGDAEAEQIRVALGSPNLLAMGSAGLKGAAVADGTADAYVSRGKAGKRWDACAPDAIVSAAGGVFTDALGLPIDYRGADLSNRHGLVAASRSNHDEIISLLRAMSVSPE